MEFAGVAGLNQGMSERERITVTPLRAEVFMITWQDGTGNTYVQVADFERESVYLNLTLPDNLEETNTKLIYREGSLRRVLSEEPGATDP
jgi:predicted ATP-binding protein involved in virulence